MTIIERVKKEYEDLSTEVKKERDEINVQLHLLNMEAKQEWHKLEKKYRQFKSDTNKLTDAAEGSAEEVTNAIKLVGDELKAGYRRVRKTLK